MGAVESTVRFQMLHAQLQESVPVTWEHRRAISPAWIYTVKPRDTVGLMCMVCGDLCLVDSRPVALSWLDGPAAEKFW